jgi:N-hydroxyarylamine O-acetyltransferase
VGIDTDRYLARIGLDRAVAPTINALRLLHRAHLEAVPFENLDIHVGRPIVLDPGLLVAKVVDQRRGGFCYELNGAFAELLRAVGFEVALLAAGVARPEPEGSFGPPFDHLALDVRIPGEPGRWLCDVGFGEGFVEPLPLEVGREDEQDTGTFWLQERGDHLVLFRRRGAGGEPEPQYRFADEPHHLSEFTPMCRYHQTDPASPFPRSRVCSRSTRTGRITLSETSLIVTVGEERTETPVDDDAAYRRALREHFGVEVTGDWITPGRV